MGYVIVILEGSGQMHDGSRLFPPTYTQKIPTFSKSKIYIYIG